MLLCLFAEDSIDEVRMGLFGKKEKAEYYGRIVDIHSHILPGVDDGSKSMEMSQEMLDIAYEEGIGIMFATPHHMPEGRNVSPKGIEERVAKLQEYADAKKYDLTILPGNEIYYHSDAPDMLEEGKICTLAGTSYVLVEFAPMDESRYIRNSLAELQNMGYDPIIAHVERYMSLCKPPFDKIEQLREMGILIQINATSIMGGFGKPTKALVEKLLKKQLVDFIGTDAHRNEGNRAPRMTECAEYLSKKYDARYVEKILYRNAEKYILSQLPTQE